MELNDDAILKCHLHGDTATLELFTETGENVFTLEAYTEELGDFWHDFEADGVSWKLNFFDNTGEEGFETGCWLYASDDDDYSPAINVEVYDESGKLIRTNS